MFLLPTPAAAGDNDDTESDDGSENEADNADSNELDNEEEELEDNIEFNNKSSSSGCCLFLGRQQC